MALGERDVTLTIKVKDNDVDQAEAKLNRLKKAANDVGSGPTNNLVNNKDLSQAERLARFMGKDIPDAASKANEAVQETANATSGAGGAAAAAGVSLGALAGGIALAAVAAVAFTAVLVNLGERMFASAKGFADYTVQVRKMTEDTGLSAEASSALNAELKEQGRAFDDLKGPMDNFRKLIGQAAADNAEAQKQLSLIGVNGKKAINDLTGAFTTAITAIQNTKDPTDQLTLAYSLFGDQAGQVVRIVNDFRGNLPAIIEHFRRLGLVVGGDGVQAGKDFDRQWGEIENTLDGIKLTLGKEFLPFVRDTLGQFASWLDANQDSLMKWSKVFVAAVETPFDMLRSLATFIENHPYIIGLVAGVPAMAGLQYANAWVNQNVSSPSSPRSQIYDPTTGKMINNPATNPIAGPDPGAFNAKQEEIAKQLKQRQEELRKEQEATARQAQQLREMLAELTFQTEHYGDKSHEAAIKQQLLKMSIKDVNQGLADQVVAQAKELDQTEKAARAKKELKDVLDGIAKSGQQQVDQLNGTLAGLEQQIGLGRELTLVEKQTIANKVEQLKLQHELEAKGFLDKDIAAAIQQLDLQQKITMEIYRQIQADQEKIAAQEKLNQAAETLAKELQQHLDDFENFKQGLQDQIDEINRGGRPLTEYEKTLKAINKDFADMPQAEKDAVLANAAWIDSVRELQAEYDKVRGTLQQIFDYALRGDFKGLGRALLDQARNAISDKLSGILATVITGYDPNATDNPVAKPIVGEIKTTNKLLSQLVRATGQSPAGGGGGAGILGSIGSIFSGGIGSILNFGGASSDDSGGGSGGSSSSGSAWDQLKQIFGSGPGGLFHPPTQSGPGSTRTAGILSGIGQIGAVVGSAVPGRWGSAISGAATGLSIGAAFGPIGAAVGAAAGFLIGLFGFSDPKKKQDKEQNIPALQKGFSDSIAQLNKILDDLRHLNIDPDDAINQATAIRADIASGFGIQFQSKKYRKQAQQMIASELLQADGIINQIKSAAEIARGAADRSKRILPEFAGGVYFADYFRPNGLVPGFFDGRDNIFAMISRGEMVLNPSQQSMVRALAGFDVFAGAGIPNYPRESSSSKLATGGIAGAGLTLAAAPVVNFNPNFQLVLVGDVFDDRAQLYLESDGGKRQQIKVIKKLKQSGDI